MLRKMTEQEIKICGMAMPDILKKLKELVGCQILCIEWDDTLFETGNPEGGDALFVIDPEHRRGFHLLPCRDDEGNGAAEWAVCKIKGNEVVDELDIHGNPQPGECLLNDMVADDIERCPTIYEVGYLIEDDNDSRGLWYAAGPYFCIECPKEIFGSTKFMVYCASRDGIGTIHYQQTHPCEGGGVFCHVGACL
jgi:hypothetical protein